MEEWLYVIKSKIEDPTMGLLFVKFKMEVKIAHEQTKIAHEISHGFVELLHARIDGVRKEIFFVEHDVLVDSLEHIVCLMPHSLHLIFVWDAERVGFRCGKVSKVVESTRSYICLFADFSKATVDIDVHCSEDVLVLMRLGFYELYDWFGT